MELQPPQHLDIVTIEKGAFGSPSTKVTNFTIYIYIYILHNLLPNLHPEINITLKNSFKELPFLDILIKNQNGQIIIDIYHKSTDTRQYHLFKSHNSKN